MSEGHPGPARRIAELLALAVIPLLVAWVGVRERAARGAMWLFSNPDPDYAYLLNALTVATGGRAAHPDHPGVPVKVAGGAALKLLSWLHGVDVIGATLLEPEAALELLSSLMGWCVASAVFVTGVVLARAGAGLGGALLVQAVPLGSVELLQRSTRLCPEPVLLILGLGLVVVCWLSLTPEQTATRRRVLCAAAVCITALGIATKLTFLPLLAVPALWWSTSPARALLTMVTTLGLAFALCLPFEAAPLGSVIFVSSMVGRGGLYGTGASRPVSLGDVPEQARELLSLLARHELLALLVIALSAALAVAIAARWRTTRARPPPAERLLLVVILAESLQLAMVLRQPSIRYVVPTIALLGLNLLLASEVLRRWRPKRSLAIATVTIVGAMTALAAQLLAELNDASHREVEAHRRASATAAAIASVRARGCVVAPFYGASTPEFALLFGDRFAGQSWGRTLQTYTPDFLFLNTVSIEFGSYLGEYDEHFLADFNIQQRCLVLFGPRQELPPLPMPTSSLGPVWGTETFVRVLPPATSAPP